jgi:hypothetical protein
MKKSQEEPLQLLKINEARLQVFLEGLDNYEFKIKQHPPSYREPIENKTFFEHFYGVMQKYAHEEADSPLGKMLVLYGVRAPDPGIRIRAEIQDQPLPRLVHLRT